MWEDIKMYMIQVGVKKYAPVAVMAAFSALGTILAAHSGTLEQFGITYGTWPFHWAPSDVPSGPCILVELDTLSAATITAVVAFAAVAIRALQHHTTGTAVVQASKQEASQ